MRTPLLALLLAALPAAAQTTEFSDADFGFSIKLPDGLRPVDEALLKQNAGGTGWSGNVPRSAADGKPIVHRYAWVDQSSPYARQAEFTLLDQPPPWNPAKPDEFVAAMTGQGLHIDAHELIKPPIFGIRAEGTFTRSDGKAMRKMILYLPDIFGKRYGMLSFQAFDSDWNIVKPEFTAAIESVQIQRADPPPEVVEAAREREAAKGGGAPGEPGQPGGPPGAHGPGGGKGGHGGGAAAAKTPPPEPPTDWASLKVAGSFALAAALLVHLLLSGRGK
ncbi:MAG TPA: hypothetical protein VFY71_07390 [Planctomycetota bacterium]|nr:hypothetical protein [Planctomycetota bacterium]